MKKYKVLIDPKAKQDLKEIFLYVAANDNFEIAEKLLNSLEATCYKLEEYPERGHIPQELKLTGIKRFLEILYKPYRVVYELENKIIYNN